MRDMCVKVIIRILCVCVCVRVCSCVCACERSEYIARRTSVLVEGSGPCPGTV